MRAIDQVGVEDPSPRHLTYANVVATAAVVVAVAGGGTAAVTAGVIGKNHVKSKHIAAGAAKSSDLARDAVTGAKVGFDSIGGAELAPGAVGGSELAAGAVGAEHLAGSSVKGAAVDEGSLGEVPSAAALHGMMRVSVDAQGEVVSFSPPQSRPSFRPPSPPTLAW